MSRLLLGLLVLLLCSHGVLSGTCCSASVNAGPAGPPGGLGPVGPQGVTGATGPAGPPGPSTANAVNSATTTIVLNGATAPTAGQVLTAISDVAASWQTPSASGLAYANLYSDSATISALSGYIPGTWSSRVVASGLTTNTATGEITIVTTGVYLVTFDAVFAFDAGAGPQTMSFSLHKNGATFTGYPFSSGEAETINVKTNAGLSAVVSLTAADVLRMAYSTVGGFSWDISPVSFAVTRLA
jgi:hypothetical protein